MPPQKTKLENQHIQVAVRLRPINTSEKKQGSYSVVDSSGDKKEVVVKERLGINPTTKTFNFDHVFPADVKQVQVYKSVVSPIISEVLSGYNCTIFAYGQTGTGKTFTMEGERTENSGLSWENDPLIGVIPRALANIFDQLQTQDVEFSVRVSFLELYNEELFDLLGSCEDPLRLRIYEDSSRKGSVIIQGLEEIVVKSKEEVYEILERGASKRQTAATLMNAFSSRSHSVFTVTIHIKENTMEGEELLKTGKLHLVDLAGSENIGRSGAVDKRAREAGNINQSLLTLGRVITALVEHAPHIPYRESKLTRILQDSLGGRTKTSIIATISPASINLEETLSTLDYAHRAKNITNRPEINQKLTKKALIREYTEEIDKLRRDLQAAREKNGIFIAEENYQAMQLKLTFQDENIAELTAKIESLTDELTKLLELFGVTKQELEEVTEKLGVTKDRLIKSKAHLRETRIDLATTQQDRDEQSFLVENHVSTETSLLSEATELLETADKTTSDLQGLHEKVDRFRAVEQHNTACEGAFSESFTGAVQDMIQQVTDFTSRQEDTISAHTEHIAKKVRYNAECVTSVTSQLRELQGCLRQKIDEISAHQRDTAAVNISWTQDLKGAVQGKMESETSHLSGVETVVNTGFSDVVGKLELMETSLIQVSQLLETQRQEQENKMKDWAQRLGANLSQLGSTVQTRTEKLTEQVTSVKQQLQAKRRYIEEKNKSIQEKLREIIKLQTESNATSVELNDIAVSSITEMDTATHALSSDIAQQTQACSDAVTQDVADTVQTAKTACTDAQNRHNQIIGIGEEAKAGVNSVQSQISQTLTDSSTAWDNLSNEVTDRCTQQETSINTELNVAYKHTDSLQGDCQTQCDKLVDTYDRQNAAIDTNAQKEKTMVADQLEATKSFAQEMTTELTARQTKVDKFMNEELRKDVPTGATPVRQEFKYPRVLSRTERHTPLLDRFRREHKVEPDLDISAVEPEPEIEAEASPAPSETNGDAITDDKSDAGSVKSSTSGFSSSVSTYSTTSKKSECKENDKQGRPLGSKQGSKKQNFSNVTPRAKTRLPLKQSNNSSANTDQKST